MLMNIRFKTIKDTAGEYCDRHITINLDADMNPARTFLHEWLHFSFEYLGIVFENDTKEHELLEKIENYIWRRLTQKQKKEILERLMRLGKPRNGGKK